MSHLNSRTREHYDSLVPSLDKSYVDYRWKSHPQQRLHYAQTRLSLRRALRAFVSAPARMLEVGCGPGTWTDELLEYAEQLTLLDISRKMLGEAKTRYRNKETISLVCGDFTSGVMGKAVRFDAIVCIRALEYMSPKLEFVREVSRLLNPGGTLILITKNPGWRDAKEESGFAERRSNSIHSDWITWTAIGRIAGEQGLDVVAVRPAAMGSYSAPLANPLGRWACHLLHRYAVGRGMSPRLDGLSESYLLAARKPDSSAE